MSCGRLLSCLLLKVLIADILNSLYLSASRVSVPTPSSAADFLRAHSLLHRKMQLRQHCKESAVGGRIKQHAVTPTRPLLHHARLSNSSSGSSGRTQPLRATSSVAETPTALQNQTNALSSQPSSLGQRPAPLRMSPAISQTVLTMDSIARATNQEQEVCQTCICSFELLSTHQPVVAAYAQSGTGSLPKAVGQSVSFPAVLHLNSWFVVPCSFTGQALNEAVKKPYRVAYQGVPGAYSEMAACKACPDAEPVPCEQFEVAFQVGHLMCGGVGWQQQKQQQDGNSMSAR